MINTSRLPILVIFYFGLVLAALQTSHASQNWIDAHFHIVGDKGKTAGFEKAAEEALHVMEQSNMERIIIMAPPRSFDSFDIDEIIGLQQKYPGKIYVLGGGGSLNPMIQRIPAGKVTPETKQKFKAIAEDIVARGAVGFGEITAHHMSLNPNHGYKHVPADHPLLLLLADIAAAHDVPINFHFDPIPADIKTPVELDSPKNPAILKENITAFERLLEYNRKTKFIWAHAGSDPVGFYTPDLVRRLFNKHPNLYCDIRTTFRRNNAMYHIRRGINDSWIEVLREYPDRFIMSTDSFIITPDYTGPKGPRKFAKRTWVQRQGANEVLQYIDEDLARKIGTENALRLYNIK